MRNLASETSFQNINDILSKDDGLRKYIFSSLGIPTDTEYPELLCNVIYGDMNTFDYYQRIEDTLYIAEIMSEKKKTFYRILASLFYVRVEEY